MPSTISAGLATGLALSAGVLSLLFVYGVRQSARRLGWLDVPVHRSSHRIPVPRLGGLGVIAAIVASTLAASRLAAAPPPWTPSLVLALAVVALISLLDDFWNLPATPRLAAHLTAALLIVRGGTGLEWWLTVACVVWIVGYINAFNFMDGIDGIAGLHALVACAAWTAIGVSTGETGLVWAGLAVGGACAGFLILNWSPASVFMGDVGATFLGAVLAAMPWLTASPRRWIAPAVILLWPFWLDVSVTLVGRVRRREILWAGHRQHFYQRLVNAGLSHAQVAMLYGALTLVGGGAAAGLAAGGVGTVVGIAAVAVAAGALTAGVRAFETSGRRARSFPVRPTVDRHVDVSSLD